ncbi:exo-alpha-sialidase [Roseovarius salinarum]|uniref:exo-alpha-sialidase n=1 Tax=Roseovarius salinarum TaxID=1981892 RepID=UPI0013000FE0|nr:exo-alpha-sialidase [Roseovarius salinarum]
MIEALIDPLLAQLSPVVWGGALAVVSLGLSAVAIRRDRPLDWRFALPVEHPADGPPLFETVFDHRPAEGQAHSPAIAVKDDGFTLVWFEGSAEAQADVDIHHARFSRDAGGGWHHDTPAPLITRRALSACFEPRQAVITLGNTIQNEIAPDAFYATVVSVGGWAMASVADVRIDPDRRVPVRAHKLNLSPLLNRSHLVKSPMVAYADGSHGLPAYFEMKHGYSELVRLDAEGRVRDVRRIPEGRNAIQPMIVPLDERHAIAFLRNFGTGSRRLLVSETADGGRHWSAVHDSDLPNPDAPVAALALGGDRILMALNDDAQRSDLLRLLLSQDRGRSWRRIATLEDGGGDADRAVRYPMLRRLRDGSIVLAYSQRGKHGIRAHVFNDAWVNAQ